MMPLLFVWEILSTGNDQREGMYHLAEYWSFRSTIWHIAILSEHC